ncbi:MULTISPECIES: aminotransferase class I/II-fold pyridoxal phosphate-dependent enzyme [unclassified Aureispira]|uniref:aminotransferase class I/II-fold pyridoxal phosphate-dependent enzyme n=1 Tax=unclassified Aureispira TaxID=2649989 RepID=UPI0006985938|nr:MULTISPECIES: aminotransferase class I/II-fold pyridoxal phosphate-dependent enzyme [unclassified Aureispira]WMX16018.1 aminotransferase class I/II-fold pyridoxal phosphate-dependent enzyme [Aureispira sp. CCB-E]
MEIKDLIINKNSNLREALHHLDNKGSGVLFIVDDNDTNKLLGILTDGDVRRFLLSEVNLETAVTNVMNANFVSLPSNADNSKILECLNNRIKIIPLLNDRGEVVDYASLNRLRRISIASPLLEGNELTYLTECIKTNWISSQGKYVRKFEALFKEYHENYEALAVSNGTVALHLALAALDIGKGDEVIVPNMTFAASINAIIYTGATPVLAEIEADTLNIDARKIEELITDRTKAIMPVHLYGQACDMNEIMRIAEKHDLLVVEDCAEALGSTYEGKPLGAFGDAATFSFYGNKTITTGEGGMVLFKNFDIADKGAVLRDHGMSKEKRYWHDYVGFNYRLTNLQAAIGVAQFERLDEFVNAKKTLAQKYNEVLSKYDFFQTPIEKENVTNSYWLYTFLINETAPFTRKDLMDFLNEKGVETRPIFFPLNVMPPYVEYAQNNTFDISERVSKAGMSLPSAVNLSALEVDYICDCLNEFVSMYS